MTDTDGRCDLAVGILMGDTGVAEAVFFPTGDRDLLEAVTNLTMMLAAKSLADVPEEPARKRVVKTVWDE